jgi:hypothetical protein
MNTGFIGGCNVEANFTTQYSYRSCHEFRIFDADHRAKHSLLRQKGWRGLVHIGRKVSLQRRFGEPIENGMHKMTAAFSQRLGN